jgi:hypothetical protein
MLDAWKVNVDMPLCFIFDYISPARQFKRGEVFDEEGPFAEYDPNPAHDPNVTETDKDGTTLPYRPIDYMCVCFIGSPYDRRLT